MDINTATADYERACRDLRVLAAKAERAIQWAAIQASIEAAYPARKVA
jgi:hypothetical protein